MLNIDLRVHINNLAFNVGRLAKGITWFDGLTYIDHKLHAKQNIQGVNLAHNFFLHKIIFNYYFKKACVMEIYI